MTQFLLINRLAQLVLSSLVTITCGVSFADTKPQILTLDAALKFAEIRSQELPAQDSAASAARNMAVSVGQRPDPILSIGVNDMPINGQYSFSTTNNSMTMRSIGLIQEITREGKLNARTAQFQRQADVAVAGRELALANLQSNTAAAWLNRYYQERIHQVLILQRNEAQLQVKATEAAYSGGRGSQSDVFAARSSVAQIDDLLVQSKLEVATAITQLARWIGPKAGETLGKPPNVNKVNLRADDIDAQLAQYPQIKILMRQEEMAQAAVGVAAANKESDVSVELMYGQRGPSYSNMVSINVFVPIQWNQDNLQDRDLAAKLDLANQARSERIELTRTIASEVTILLQAWESDQKRLTHYDKSVLPLATQNTRVAIAAYRGGNSPLAQVIQARQNELESRMARLRIELNASRLWAQINYLIPDSHVTRGTFPR